MKKFLVVFLLLCMLSPVSFGWDRTFTVVVDASTYAVVGTALEIVNFALDIASTPRGERIKISRIQISNSDTFTRQVVTLYDNGNSTNTLTELWKVDLSSTNNVFLHFTEKIPLIAENGLVIRKSDIASTITVDVLYW